MGEKKMTYAKAIAELQDIVNHIEKADIDVDILTDKVKRAIFLIKFCRERLHTTDKEIRKVLSEIEETQEQQNETKENDSFNLG